MSKGYMMDRNGFVSKALMPRTSENYHSVLMVDPTDHAQMRRIADKAGASTDLVWSIVTELIEEDNPPPMEEPMELGSVVSAMEQNGRTRVNWVRIAGGGNGPWAYGGSRRSWGQMDNPEHRIQ